MKINYVIAVWSGLRRVNPQAYLDDRTIYLRTHLESLAKLKHNLAQITVVVNQNPDPPPEFVEYIGKLPNEINGVPVRLMKHNNNGWSYGAYSKAYKATCAQGFDYYMLMEDDYIFTLDHFDTAMLDIVKEYPRCGFLTFWLERTTLEWIIRRAGKIGLPPIELIKFNRRLMLFCQNSFHYSRVTLGLLHDEAASKMMREFNCLPHAKGTTHGECKIGGQFCLPAGVQKIGMQDIDVLPRYRISAYSPDGVVLTTGPADAPKLIGTVQELLPGAADVVPRQADPAVQSDDGTSSGGSGQ